MCLWSRLADRNHLTACSMAAISASKAVCCPPRLRAPSAMTGPSPLLSVVISQPKPAALRKDPSVQAWYLSIPSLGLVHGVLSRTLGELVSTCRPSLTRRLLSLASENHRGIRCLLESSVALGGRRSRLCVPSGAASAEASSRSRLRSNAGFAGGVSAALMASSPLAELKVPATDLPMAVVSRLKPSRSQVWPS
jgi:hypothetical protein